MTKLESDIVEIKNSLEEVYSFLSNLNNFEKLMPEQVVNWKSTEDSCSFTIKGMADLNMSISEKIPYSKVVLISGDKAPFNFTLTCQLHEQKENQLTAHIIFNAELSTILELLAKNPLRNFINMLKSKLKELGDKLKVKSEYLHHFSKEYYLDVKKVGSKIVIGH